MQLKKSIRAVLAALITALLGAAGLVLAPGAHAVPNADTLGNPNLEKTGSITFTSTRTRPGTSRITAARSRMFRRVQKLSTVSSSSFSRCRGLT